MPAKTRRQASRTERKRMPRPSQDLDAEFAELYVEFMEAHLIIDVCSSFLTNVFIYMYIYIYIYISEFLIYK